MLFTQQVFHLECMFTFLLTFFDTSNYYFRSNLSLVLLIKPVLVYSVFHWDDIVEEVLPKTRGLEKKIKRGVDHIGEGVVYRREVQTFFTL